MATVPRPSLIRVAREEPLFPLPERVTVALAQLSETARQGLLAFCVGIGLSVMHEIFEEEVTLLVGPRGKHDPERPGYRHGREDRQLTLGGRRAGVKKPRERPILAVIDGGKAIRSALNATFEDRVLIQRCREHYADVEIMPTLSQVPIRTRQFLSA